MSVPNIVIREAFEQDCDGIIELIKELAVYEKAGHEVEIKAEDLRRDGFGDMPQFKVLIAEQNSEIQGMAFYYFKYSTWKGRCLFLEDLVIRESSRRKGIGSRLFEAVISVSHAEKVKRMEWQVLDWNEPAIGFYKKYKAELDGEWVNGRFYQEDISRLSSGK